MGCHAHAPLMRHALAEHEHAAFVKICVFRGKTKRTSPRMGPTLVARGETPRNQIENTHSPRMGPAYQRVLTSLHSTPIYVGPSGASVFVWANRSQGSSGAERRHFVGNSMCGGGLAVPCSRSAYVRTAFVKICVIRGKTKSVNEFGTQGLIASPQEVAIRASVRS